MILQSKVTLKTRVSVMGRTFADRLDKFRKRHRVCKRIDGSLVNDSHMLGKWAISLHLAPQGNDAGKISHSLTDILPGSICHWRSNDDVVLARPARKRDLECGQQRAKQRGAI